MRGPIALISSSAPCRASSVCDAQIDRSMIGSADRSIAVTKLADVPVIEVLGEPSVLSVDPSYLDPALIDPDEDIVMDHLSAMVDTPPPYRSSADGVELAGQAGRLAEWADTTEGFDRSDVTERSLFEHQRISYRGTIAAEAIAVVDVPSEHQTIFLAGIGEILNVDFGPPPRLGMSLTEAARVRALGTALVRGLVASVGVDVEIDLSDHEPARATAETLRQRAAGMRVGDLEQIKQSLIVSAAEAIAEQAAELDPISVRFALDGALEIANVAVAELGQVLADEVLPMDRAVEIVSEAMVAVREAPWETGVPWHTS